MNQKKQPKSGKRPRSPRSNVVVEVTAKHPDIKLENETQEPRSYGSYAQRKQSAVKERLRSVSYVMGDRFKKVGMKLQQKGYERAGRVIEKVGNNLGFFGA